MALALNVFQTVTAIVDTSPTVIYSAPVGYTGVVLLAQVANIGETSEDVTLIHRRSVTDTEMLKEFPDVATQINNVDRALKLNRQGVNRQEVLELLQQTN